MQLCTHRVQETRSGVGAADSVWGWTYKEIIQRTEGGKQKSAAGHHGVWAGCGRCGGRCGATQEPAEALQPQQVVYILVPGIHKVDIKHQVG